MSRIGKKPIKIPEGVEIKIEKRDISIKGPLGSFEYELPRGIIAETKEGELIITPQTKSQKHNANWGLSRSLLQNYITGAKSNFEKKLEIKGVGYKANMKSEKELQLAMGFSHPVIINVPEDLKVEAKKNLIIVSGSDKQRVGQFSAEIRQIRPPEPYKGKGIRYQGELVRRKEGKKAGSV